MQPAIHTVFKIGTLTSLVCMVLMTYLSVENYFDRQSPGYAMARLVASGGETNDHNNIPLRSNNQNAPEVEEDDDDSAREFFSYPYSELNETNFSSQIISTDYAPVQGEISTPPPRG